MERQTQGESFSREVKRHIELEGVLSGAKRNPLISRHLVFDSRNWNSPLSRLAYQTRVGVEPVGTISVQNREKCYFMGLECDEIVQDGVMDGDILYCCGERQG